jgi:hypothetical protein
MIEQSDRSGLNTSRIVLGIARHHGLPGNIDPVHDALTVNDRPIEDADGRTHRGAAPQNAGVIAGDHVVTGAPVDAITGVMAACDVVTANQIIIPTAAVKVVITLLAEDYVMARFAVNRVVPTQVNSLFVNRGKRKRRDAGQWQVIRIDRPGNESVVTKD